MEIRSKFKQKDPGVSTMVFCLMFIIIAALLVTYAFKMKAINNTKAYVDDAITNANLSASIIDAYDYGATGNVTNFDYDSMYKQYLITLAHDLDAEIVDGKLGVTLKPRSNARFASDVNVLKFYVYNKTAEGVVTLAKVVDNSESGLGGAGVYFGGSLEKQIDEAKAITPDGTYMEDDYSSMMIYSQIGFEVSSVFGASHFYGTVNSPTYVTKAHSTDVITSHKYEEIDRVEPTCTEDGYILYQCTSPNCPRGENHQYKFILEKLGHYFDPNYKYEDNNGVINGHRYLKCTKCDATTNDQYKVELNHDGLIESCGGSGYYNPGDTVSITCVVKDGATFKGWTGTYNFNKKDTSFTMPEHAISLTGEAHITYVIRYWMQNLNGGEEENEQNYTLFAFNTGILEGPTNTITVVPKYFPELQTPEAKTVTISSTKDVIVDFYCKRAEYTINIVEEKGVEEVTGAGKYKYGEIVKIEAKTKENCEFIGWKDLDNNSQVSNKNPFIFEMPSKNLNYGINVKLTPVQFAIYSEDDNSLDFYNSTDVPYVGENYNGKIVTAIYKNVGQYGVGMSNIPWVEYKQIIKSVTVVDEIAPKYTQYWFRDFYNCESFELDKLNMSNVQNTSQMFYSAGSNAENFYLDLSSWDMSNITTINSMFFCAGQNSKSFNIVGLSEWDVSNVVDMGGVFYKAGYNSETFNIDVTNWDTSKTTNMESAFREAGKMATAFSIGDMTNWETSKVTTMKRMFNNAGSKAESFQLDLSNWNVSNVTDMSYMFYNAGYTANIFDIDLSNWDVSNVANMSCMFGYAGYNATIWNIGKLNNWNVSKVKNMSYMFYNAGYTANIFDIDLSNWDVSNVANMSCMFGYAGSSATTWDIGKLDNWDVSKVKNMSYMFCNTGYNATIWEIGNLSSWEVSNVTDMSYMFYDAGNKATIFDIGNLNNWDVSNVVDMGYLFAGAGENSTVWEIGNLSSWEVSNVTDMSYMFYYAGSKATIFDIGNLNNWDVSNVANMSFMFGYVGSSATTWNIGKLNNWNVSKVKNMSHMFCNAGYNATIWEIGNLSSWEVSNVTNMSYMFYHAGNKATIFDIGNLNNWDVSNVANMSYMFAGAWYSVENIDIDLSNWNVSNVTTMKRMFAYFGNDSKTFKLNLSNWDVSNVTNIDYMFDSAGYEATKWELDGLATWDTSNVTTMRGVFRLSGYSIKTYDMSDINNWNVSNVTDTYEMFYRAGYNSSIFNMDLSNWNVSKVTNMVSTFNEAGYKATTWSVGDLSTWDTSNVTGMSSMFKSAGRNAKYLLDLSSWNVNKVKGHNYFNDGVTAKIIPPIWKN